MITLGGCNNAGKVPPAVTVKQTGCEDFAQITWSTRDTPETSTQVRRHNRTHAELCPSAKVIANAR
jgi:hypothetical protein